MKLLIFLCLIGLPYISGFKVEGRIVVPDKKELTKVRVVLDDGSYIGFVKPDGRFTIFNVPSKGSYIAQVLSPTYVFEPVRVEITSKGQIRARKLSHLKPSAVSLVHYPLEMRAIGTPKYFQQREKFSIFDMLKNPMVLMMLVPVLALGVLPRMVNTQDPEVRKEMEEQMKMFNTNQNQIPDMSDMFTKWFGNSAARKPKPAIRSSRSSMKR